MARLGARLGPPVVVKLVRSPVGMSHQLFGTRGSNLGNNVEDMLSPYCAVRKIPMAAKMPNFLEKTVLTKFACVPGMT
jgi:hypothetical protein